MLDTLSENYPVTSQDMKQGFLAAEKTGRFTMLDKEGRFYMDGAHNEGAALALKESIETYFTNKPIIYIMGMLKDKEYEKVSDILTGYAAAVIVITPHTPRGLDKFELARAVMDTSDRNRVRTGGKVVWGSLFPPVSTADSLEEAVEMARLLSGEEGIILAFGSLSFLGELKEITDKEKSNGRSGKSAGSRKIAP